LRAAKTKVRTGQPRKRDGIKIEPAAAVRLGDICGAISGLKNRRSASAHAKASRGKEKVTLEEQDRVKRRERI
jgi:hypothetical protein